MVFHHLLTILQIFTYFNPIIGLADEITDAQEKLQGS